MEQPGDQSEEARPDISVVIPARNAADTIGEQLAALAMQDRAPDFEVVVVENGSSDRTAEVVRAWAPRLPGLHLVTGVACANAAEARNVGVRTARGERLLFCDADDAVAPGWVAALAASLDDHDLVAGAFDLERLNQDWLTDAVGERQVSGLQRWGDWEHAGSGNLGMRRSLFDQLDGFDPWLDALEDTDLCFRARLAGHGIHFVADAVVSVRFRGTLRGVYRQGRAWGRARIMLHGRYREDGMPPFPVFRLVGGWGLAVPRLVFALKRGGLVKWTHRLGWRVGLTMAVLRGRQRPGDRSRPSLGV